MKAVLDAGSQTRAGRRLVTVEASEMRISRCQQDVLVTYGLGACVGLVLYDPVVRVGGMIHCLLPLSKIDPKKSRVKPAMFVDTGVTNLLQAVYDHGAQRKNLVAKIAGAGSSLGHERVFKIGQRNHMVARKILWKNNILLQSEDIDGPGARSLYLEIGSGRTVVESASRKVEL